MGIVLSANKESVLLIERRDVPIWTLPGGGIEANESPEQAVIREFKEETGYDVSVLRKIGEYKFPKKIQHVFECYILGGVASSSNESKNVLFYPVSKLPEMISPYVTYYIEDALDTAGVVIKKDAPRLPSDLWLKAISHPYAFIKYLLTTVGIHWNSR
jgi:8-oxo-dGTP diphosphatase